MALKERVSFEQFLADLTAEFVNLSLDRVGDQVQRGLARLVEFLSVDRSSLGQFTPERRLAVFHSYALPGIPTLPPGDFETGLNWYVEELAQGRVVRVPSVDALPPFAIRERESMRAAGMKSHLGIPICVGGMPPYVLGIATYRRELELSEELIPRLQLIGGVFANALLRRDTAHSVQRMRAELAHVTRVSTVGHLATSIAHEINQPLCAIVSNAQAALRLLSVPESCVPDSAIMTDVRAALHDIVADGRRAADVMARSHALLKRRDLEFKRLSINDVVADVFAMIHSDAVIRRVTLQTVPGESLPDIIGDRVQLQQVVLNIILNALEATADAPDGPRLVTVRTTSHDAAVRVLVEDTGGGLTPEVAAMMFEPFFTTKPHGLGMGLAINRSIVQAHNGSMGAAAAAGAGRGAVVWFDLPFAEAAPVAS